MSISFMADNGIAIPCARDGAVYDLIGGGENYVIDGIGNNLRLNYNATSLGVTIGSGIGVIRGRHVQITGTESLTLPASSSGYVVIEYDLSQTGANICKPKVVTEVTNGNINNGENVSDLVIGSFVTGRTGVTTFTDMRKIYSGTSYAERSGVSERTNQLRWGTEPPSDTLGVDGDFYAQIEG